MEIITIIVKEWTDRTGETIGWRHTGDSGLISGSIFWFIEKDKSLSFEEKIETVESRVLEIMGFDKDSVKFSVIRKCA